MVRDFEPHRIIDLETSVPAGCEAVIERQIEVCEGEGFELEFGDGPRRFD